MGRTKQLGGEAFDNSLIFKEEGEAVDIIRRGVYIRTFSEKQHGAKFEEMAAEYCANRKDGPYDVVDSSKIPAVKVVYREKTESGAYIDKEKLFEDKYAAHFFNNEVHGTILVAD